jgi:hypothetical protein
MKNLFAALFTLLFLGAIIMGSWFAGSYFFGIASNLD